MAYWLFKSEPDCWSWEEQKALGAKAQEWDGVRNYQARNFMRSMARGERGFFYHSGGEKRIVGVVEVGEGAHPDSTDGSGMWECVDLVAVADMPRPVTLDAVKAEPRLADMVLVKNARLSVQPVSEEEWRVVCRMGGLEPV